MAKPAYQIEEDYEAFGQYVLSIVSSHWKEIWRKDIDLERRFLNLEKGQEQILNAVQTLETNLILYRNDSKEFMKKTEESNEKFRDEMRGLHQSLRNEVKEFTKKTEESNKEFRNEIKELIKKTEESNKEFRDEINQRFEKIDQRFEKIDQRFERIDKQFIDVHKAINRMTVVFIGGLGTIVLLSKIIDKIWP